VADNIRNVLRDIVREGGLDPTKLMDDWQTLGHAVKTWLESGHLEKITIEFSVPGSTRISARWDFPVSYDGSGADDDMWVSKEHILRTIAKAARPPANAVYRVILINTPGRPDVPGMASTDFKSTEGMICRSAGTSIATPDVMAGLQYWRAA
jgi:hypothetical protein